MAVISIQGIQDTLGLSSETARQRDVERQLDDAGADSFPASDPVSLAMPHDAEEMGRSRPSSTTLMLVGGGLLALIALIALRR